MKLKNILISGGIMFIVSILFFNLIISIIISIASIIFLIITTDENYIKRLKENKRKRMIENEENRKWEREAYYREQGRGKAEINNKNRDKPYDILEGVRYDAKKTKRQFNFR